MQFELNLSKKSKLLSTVSSAFLAACKGHGEQGRQEHRVIGSSGIVCVLFQITTETC
jgi:hypothetical protein